ncbi:MAG: hypothetical protein JW748_03475 [Anaerolineales bacterium]|nr:hypothetical protein [Anaerolineales bacterium]
MSAANYPKKRLITITVHPPEADRIADAFAGSRAAVELDLAALELVAASLESGWEGKQKSRYLDELSSLIGRIRNTLLPQLQSMENKYREYLAEKTVEAGGTA